MFGKKFALLCSTMVFVCLTGLIGCGGIAAVGVAINASSLNVDGTDTVTLTATVTNDHNNAGVTWTLSGAGGLSNTTTSSATYTAPAATSSAQTVTITATSIGDTTKSATVTLTVQPAPSITTAGPLNGTVGTAYAVTLAGTGGVTPYTWTVASGSVLPNGVTLSAAGQIAGIPPASAAGSTTVTFNLKDSGTPTALTASKAIQFVIAPAPAFSFVGTMPTAANINTTFNGSAQATGGAGTLTYNLASGALPNGTGLNSATGAVTGTLTAAGTFNFTIGVSDAFGDVGSQSYAVTVSYPAMSITTSSSLAAAYVNGNYSQALAATGGTNLAANYSWTLNGGTTLPVGLSLSTGGVISGKPTGATGTTNFTVKVTDTVANLSTTQGFSIVVNAGVSITTGGTLAAGYANSNYSTQLAATGGTGTGYTWTVTSGSTLPAGLTLSSGGLLSGKPTTVAGNSFNITVTDSASNTANQTFSLTVNAGVSVTSSATLPKGYQGGIYPGATLSATGGSGTGYNWSWAAASGSSIPTGMLLNNVTGGVSGTPTQSGTFSIVVTVTDSVSNTASQTVSLTIEASLAISPSTLPSGTANVAYSQTLTATGGSGTGYTWTSLGNTNPGLGITLSTGGVISGTPTTAGSTTITAQVTDSESHQTSAPLTVTVFNALTITTTTLPAGNQGAAYLQNLAAAGGSGSGFTWTTTASTLSTYGLSLSGAGVVSGTPTQSGTATFTAKVTDSSNNSTTQNLSVQVYSALSLPSGTSLPNGYTNVAYSGAITGGGGSGTLSIAITTALSPSNGTLGTSISSNTVNVTGTPTTATSETLTVKLTDTATSNFISQVYAFTINTATPPSLPVLTLPAGTVSQAYSSNITATGGVGPNYTWTVNSAAVPTNGSTVSLGSGLTVSNNGGSVLTLGGTPTASGPVNFTAQVMDVTTNLTSSTQSYSITVNSAGSQINGTTAITNFCGNLSLTPPTYNFAISTSPVQNVQSTGFGLYTFASIPNGTYTITPSYAGPSGSSAVFYPATASVTVNNGTVTVPTFLVSLGYTVSGTVAYTGSHTGPIFVSLINNNCSGNGGFGTAITSAGSYTIHGVPPGNYSLFSWVDATDLGLGQGILNTSDPKGNSGPVSVTTNNVSSANVTISNLDPTAVPAQTPTLNAIFGAHTGVVIAFNPAVNGNKVESATSYDVAWSASPTLSSGALASVAGTFNYKANGNSTVWILNNSITGASSFADGTTYYFMARANNAFGHGAWVVYGGSTPTGTTVNPPSGAATISGNVTIPAGVTVNANAKLYVGFFSDTAGVYATLVSSPAVGSNNPYTLNVPTGTWQFFAILDQNNDGQIDTGDVSNTRNTQGGPPTITISGSGTQNVTLTNTSIVTVLQSRYTHFVGSGATSDDYAFSIGAGPGVKQPIAFELTAATNPNIPVPMDISNYCLGCGEAQFDVYQDIHSDIPAVGDTYTFAVKYSDGTTDNNLTVAVSGWNGTGTLVGPSAIPTNLLPTGATGPSAGTRTQPTFSWTYPAGASTAGDNYYFALCCNSNNDIWDVPGQNSNSNGLTYAQVPGGSITWNVDPSGSGSTPSLSSLTVGTQYSWSITATDSNGNQATSGTWYQP